MEGFGRCPDFPQIAVLYVVEFQAWNDFRGVAWKRFAGRRDQHELASPAAHAGLGKFRVIIGDDVFDANFSAEAFLRALEKFDGIRELLARRQKMLAIGESPAVVLHMGKFHARRAGGFRECQHFRELLDVAPVDHEVEGDGDAASFQPFERAKLLRVGFRAGDFRCDFLARALEAELQMIEAGSEERVELGFVEGKAGGDEIDVQA